MQLLRAGRQNLTTELAVTQRDQPREVAMTSRSKPMAPDSPPTLRFAKRPLTPTNLKPIIRSLQNLAVGHLIKWTPSGAHVVD